MDMFSAKALAIALSWAGTLSMYSVTPGEAPTYMERDNAWFVEVFCEGDEKCVTVGTFDRFNDRVIMSTRLKNYDDLEARSFLVHEMCHYLQWHNGGYKLNEKGELTNRGQIERYCYAIQKQFMTRHGQPYILFSIPDGAPY